MPSPFSLLPSLLPTYACLAVRTFLTLDAHPHPTSCPPNSKFTSVLPVSPELSSRVPKSFPKRNETLPRLASFVESRGLFLPPTLCSAQGQAHTLALSNEQSKQTSVFSFPDPLRTSQQRLPPGRQCGWESRVCTCRKDAQCVYKVQNHIWLWQLILGGGSMNVYFSWSWPRSKSCMLGVGWGGTC